MADSLVDDIIALKLASAKWTFASSVLKLVFAGIQIFVVFYGFSVFLETPRHLRKGRVPYIVLSFVILMIFCAAVSLNTYFIFNYLVHGLGDNGSQSLEMAQASLKAQSGFLERVASIYLVNIFIWICDAVLLYRCYVVWKDKWWICIVPLALYVASIGLAINEMVSIPAIVFSGMTHFGFPLLSAGWVLTSVSVNIITTSLIAFRLIVANRRLSTARSSSGPTGKGEAMSAASKVVTLLIESALPASFFGLIYGISLLVPAKLFPPYGNGTLGEVVGHYALVNTSYAFFTASVALAPQLIIFRVTTGRSWASSSGRGSMSPSMALSRPVTFYNGDIESSASHLSVRSSKTLQDSPRVRDRQVSEATLSGSYVKDLHEIPSAAKGV
ncbi:hypothetical protein FA15DRAFT_646506 [Coprinopsis marcescibilis]|uniref:G-protein coupled receptors family 1 profile domain-containing protein n=1 Tax=Coprinopsis marcescibilis TaxID=230819 RepID=A0A5C3KXY9_COPMA|nr:hypothetical protein FA15DRAFT_646506 [Coprinopsis marcescibilis]